MSVRHYQPNEEYRLYRRDDTEKTNIGSRNYKAKVTDAGDDFVQELGFRERGEVFNPYQPDGEPQVDEEGVPVPVEAQAQRADAYRIHQDRQAVEGQRMFADVMIAHGAQAAARDVAAAQAHGAQQVAGEQRRQAENLAQLAADRDIVRFNANLVERRDNLVGDRARQGAELRQLQDRVAQENRERDAERAQALELTARA